MGKKKLFWRITNGIVTVLTLYGGTAMGAQKLTVAADYGKLPLHFEPNVGQARADVRYVSKTNRGVLLLDDTGATLRIAEGHTLRMSALGGLTTRPEANPPFSGHVNYLVGREPSKWHTDVPTYGRVQYRGIYKGIDLVFYGNQRQLEYDFIVSPGQDPSAVRVRFEGQKSTRIDRGGDLILDFGSRAIRQTKPVAYQEINGSRKYVAADYSLTGNEVGFRVGKYDTTKPLVIDPTIVYSRFVGGTNADVPEAVALDSAGNAYLTGYTFSSDFTTNGTYSGGTDAFVTKIDPSGVNLLYSTYLGGTDNDFGRAIAVDSTGSAYITGETKSPALPAGASFGTAGDTDVFLTKLNPAGNASVYWTYLRGSGPDAGLSIALDASQAVYIAGYSGTGGLGGVANSGARGQDAFVAKIQPEGTSIAFITYLGDARAELAAAIALDSSNNIFVAGKAEVVPPPSNQDVSDGFIAKLNSSGTAVAQMNVAGSGSDEVVGVAVDSSGAVYIVGDSTSPSISSTNVTPPPSAGQTDVIIAKLNNALTQYAYFLYLGGSGIDQASGIAVDQTGAAYITGTTYSSNFPLLNAGTLTTRGGAQDAFAAKVHPAGTAFLYSVLLGGSASDLARKIAVDSAGSAYVVGFSSSSDYPRTTGPGLNGIFQDAFISKLSGCSLSLAAASGSVSASGGSGTVSVTGSGECGYLATSLSPSLTITGPASGTGTSVVSYSVTANTSGAGRTLSLVIGGQTVTITQPPQVANGCTFSLSSSGTSSGPDGMAGSFALNTQAICAWTASSSASYAQVYPLTGTGSAPLSYTLFPNFSSQARTAVITAGDQTFTLTQSANLLTSDQRFVQLLYFSFLGRLPTAGELNFQVTQGIPQGRAQLVTNFFNSQEFNQGGRFIAGLYVGILGRNAEFGGYLFQRNALITGVTNPQTLVNSFLTSAEFQISYGTLSNDAFVRFLYQNVLLRQPSQAEVDFQRGALETGQTNRVGMATQFLNSDEFRAGTGARLTAFLLYAGLLQREISQSEYNALLPRLSVPNPPLQTIIQEIISSPEFVATIG